MPKSTVVLLGDAQVGKSAIAMSVAGHPFRKEYDATVEDTYKVEIEVRQFGVVTVDILDTGGSEEVAELMPEWLTSGEAFMLVFDVGSPPSFEKLAGIHQTLIKTRGKDIPVVVVGNKGDTAREISFGDAIKWSKSIGAVYVDTICQESGPVNVEKAFSELIFRALGGTGPVVEKASSSSSSKHSSVSEEKGVGCNDSISSDHMEGGSAGPTAKERQLASVACTMDLKKQVQLDQAIFRDHVKHADLSRTIIDDVKPKLHDLMQASRAWSLAQRALAEAFLTASKTAARAGVTSMQGDADTMSGDGEMADDPYSIPAKHLTEGLAALGESLYEISDAVEKLSGGIHHGELVLADTLKGELAALDRPKDSYDEALSALKDAQSKVKSVESKKFEAAEENFNTVLRTFKTARQHALVATKDVVVASFQQQLSVVCDLVDSNKAMLDYGLTSVNQLEPDVTRWRSGLQVTRGRMESSAADILADHEAAVSSSVASAVLKEGSLSKKGRKRRNWLGRHIVLKHKYLTYYDSLKNKNLKGVVPLVNVVVEECSIKPNSFSIAGPLRTFYFAAKSSEELKEWLTAIRGAVVTDETDDASPSPAPSTPTTNLAATLPPPSTRAPAPDRARSNTADVLDKYGVNDRQSPAKPRVPAANPILAQSLSAMPDKRSPSPTTPLRAPIVSPRTGKRPEFQPPAPPAHSDVSAARPPAIVPRPLSPRVDGRPPISPRPVPATPPVVTADQSDTPPVAVAPATPVSEPSAPSEAGGTPARSEPIDTTFGRQGYLSKKGAKRRNWQTRWFILNKEKLRYFKMPSDTSPKGEIVVSEIQKVEASEHKAHCISIHCAGREFLVCAKNQPDQEGWIASIKKAAFSSA
eukprot:TRINITY_DN4266_c0_g1_i1.p1 TRINITY_DN4266_c0_g1~~TRINITY_DN4266_c0_g1_i1.p1  ORF type:complete len:957 (-),score=227.24 TRINITY_DN4266_c0_g1_i1:171-2777(-)